MNKKDMLENNNALLGLKSLKENNFAHYQQVENAIAQADLTEIKSHYCRIHGIPLDDADTERKFPWHLHYRYGDASECCIDCEEIEMAIAVNIAGGNNKQLAEWFPGIASQALPSGAVFPHKADNS
jgi:hypothetical protein